MGTSITYTFKFNYKKLYLAALILSIVALAVCSPRTPETASDVTLFINGDILTMNDAQPSAEAIAVKDGRIIAVGNDGDVRKSAGKNPKVRDLSGHTLLPGFIDTDGHIAGGAFTAGIANLQPPPAGNVSNFAGLIAELKQWSDKNPNAPWIIGFGYDDSLLTEGRHPTRAELDKISTERPVVILHVSGHLAVCNTPCLAASGISEKTQDPPGGIIRRKPNSNEPDGVLEETARMLPLAKMPRPNLVQTTQAIIHQQSIYASHGITTAQEGATDIGTVKLLESMADANQLKIDIVAYPAIHKPEDYVSEITSQRTYKNGFRVGGIKMILDGSPQGKTAWITEPYHIVPDGNPNTYSGYPILKTENLDLILNQAFEKGDQVIAHANGDAAADQLLGSVGRANEANGNSDRRTVMIHAQTVRDDQIDTMKAENIIPSYFVAHTFFWGDWHRDSVLGEARAARISPLQTTLSKGVPFSIHNDAPVVPPDMMRLVWTAVMRETRSGQILGEYERISPTDALRAVTINAAYQYFEEGNKGSLEVGKLADLVILSDNPTTIAPIGIKDIKILETIKEGQTIFSSE